MGRGRPARTNQPQPGLLPANHTAVQPGLIQTPPPPISQPTHQAAGVSRGVGQHAVGARVASASRLGKRQVIACRQRAQRGRQAIRHLGICLGVGASTHG